MADKLLDGKVCLITGSNRGIGKAITELFAEQGATVYAFARQKGSLEELKEKFQKDNQSMVRPIYFDITDYAAQKEAILQIKKECKKIDVLVNNAAMSSNELIGMISRDKVRSMMETNVIAVIEMIQLVSRLMKRQRSGSIVNLSSIVGVKGDEGQLAYSATKGAVISLTKSAAKELGSYNIRVNSIAPGITETEMYKEVDEEKMKHRLENIKMQRIAQPTDIANACLFFASDLSAYVSGQVLGVDGCSVL